MLNIKREVTAVLLGIEGVRNAFFYYPASFEPLPCISYYEINNSPYLYADDGEYVSEVCYQIDIWSAESAEASEIAERANFELVKLGFLREFSRDIYDKSAKAHKTMRYKYIGG
jgi:hypothetical protein